MEDTNNLSYNPFSPPRASGNRISDHLMPVLPTATVLADVNELANKLERLELYNKRKINTIVSILSERIIYKLSEDYDINEDELRQKIDSIIENEFKIEKVINIKSSEKKIKILCTATTKNGDPCSRARKKHGLCGIHLRSLEFKNKKMIFINDISDTSNNKIK